MTLRDEGETYSGTPSEIAQVLHLEIAAHRAHMHTSLDAAFATMELLMGGEMEAQGEERIADMEPVFEYLEATFGKGLEESTRNALMMALTFELAKLQGISMCAMWQWAHAIEHATMQDETVQ